MSLKQQAISGVKWTTVSTMFLATAQLIKVSVLARFLDKSDFGLMAIVMVVLGFTNLFVNMGLTSAILHKQNITKNEYASLYWLNFGFSFLVFVIVWLITPFIADFYRQPELNSLIPLMALTILFTAFGRQFKVIEQKELNFKFISLVDIITSVISLAVAILLAYYGFGVYALVYSVMVLQILSNTAFLVQGIKRIGIKLHFVFAETKPFLKIGIYQVGGQVINYFNRDLDILIVGKFFGAEILGGYSLAKQLVFRPAQVFSPILTKVATPVFAKQQNNLTSLQNNYQKLLKFVSSFYFLVYLGMIVFAKYIVWVLYGKDYLTITLVVQILSVYMYLRSIASVSGSLVVALGKTNLDFYWNLIAIAVMPLVIIFASHYNIYVLALSLVFVMLLFYVPFWYLIIYKTIRLDLIKYIKASIPNPMVLWQEYKHIRR